MKKSVTSLILEKDILDIILSVSVTRSSGFDEVPCHLLRQIVEVIKSLLTELINIPNILKNTIVQPVF